MAKVHDENKDVRIISHFGKIDYSNKTIRIAKTQNVGIRVLGRIDYLVNHCGYHLVWDNSAVVSNFNKSAKKKLTREEKKERKAPKLNNKNKKNKA